VLISTLVFIKPIVVHVGPSVPFLGLLSPFAHFNLSVRQPVVVHVRGLYLPPLVLLPFIDSFNY
jgi:hypothetical protein